MRLAETITIRLGERSLELRPTLRAAMRLERAHGLENLGEKLLDLHVGAISDTISATAYGPYEAEEIAALIISGGMVDTAMQIAPALVELLEGLAGIDPDAEELPAATKADEKRPSIAETHRTLFRIGTGKIGWTPEQALNATPLEIVEAWKGRLELLRDIFGGAEDKPNDQDRAATADDRFASGIRALGTKKVVRVQRNQAITENWSNENA